MLERIWREKRHILLSIAHGVAFDESLAEDLIQEAFARTLQAEKDFKDPAQAFKFMVRVVTNAAVDHYRLRLNDAKAARRLDASGFSWCSGPHRPYGKNSLQNPFNDPLDLLIREERLTALSSTLCGVEEALSELPPKLRQAVHLAFGCSDKPLAKVARENGLAASTLRSRVLSAVDKIRRRLRQRGLLQGFETDDFREAKNR